MIYVGPRGEYGKWGPRTYVARTSTALQTSFSVLHLDMPSTTAPTISSTYFSSESELISLRIWSWFSKPTDWRIRLMRAVCRFKDESSAFVGSARICQSFRTLSQDMAVQRTRSSFRDIQLLESGALGAASLLVVYFSLRDSIRCSIHSSRIFRGLVFGVKEGKVDRNEL